MKGLWRTIGGKVALYIASILALAITVGSCVGVIVIADLEFYTQSKETAMYQVTERDVLSRSFELVSRYDGGLISGMQEQQGNLSYQLCKGDGSIVLWTDDSTDTNWEYEFSHLVNDEQYVFKASVNGLKINDSFKRSYDFYSKVYDLRYVAIISAIVSFVLFIVVSIALLCVAGKRKGSDDIHKGIFTHLPFDFMCILLLGMEILVVSIVAELINDYDSAIGTGIIVAALIAPAFFMDLAIRIKMKNLIKNTLIYRLLAFIKKLIINLPLVWRTAIILFVVNLVELIIVFMDSGVGLFAIAIEKVIAIPLVLYIAIMMRKLQKQGKLLAEGDIDTTVDTNGLIWDFKVHSNNLNSIAIGMNKAVDAKLKSERMKTELITNVSHDIKTPLTSIINYCTLIEGEKTDNEKIAEYTEVVIRQSNKLKRLIENLVEASKASTGNLEVSLTECDAGMFVSQCSGEYDDKLENSKLTLVTKISDENLKIKADGKHMWRVFDNLMNNICKYSLEGTRVFLTLEKIEDQAVFTFKNISREPLDISEEELMERFVRGDSSRNTEGNGLGLSIARSLTEIQGGTLNIDIDGDFFKAILRFPLVK